MKKLSLLFLLLFLTTFYEGQVRTAVLPTGSGTWVAPCDVTSITIEVWGAGGGGGSAQGNPSTGGGGAGGGYVKTTYLVSPGTAYSYLVGAGGYSGTDGESSWFSGSNIISAVGGKSASTITYSNTSGLGAASLKTGNIGGTLTSTYGGNGGNASSTYGGGGGSSGGSTAGNNAAGNTAGTAPPSGYSGASGTTVASNNGSAGGTGAGGSGAYAGGRTNRIGGYGGDGRIQITYNSAFQAYCSKSFLNVEPITNVTFAGINNTTPSTSSGTLPHESFCQVASVMQGGTYPISLQGNTFGNYADYFRLYIDWDQNGIFGNNTNEIYDIGTITNSDGTNAILTKSVVVPSAALVGTTRMRVVKNYNSYTDACTTESFGQSEGYTVTVSAQVPCAGTPIGGNTIVSSPSGLPSSSFSASVSGSTAAAGLTYQWESASTSTGPWSPISGATGTTATIQAPNIPAITYYRRKITCTASGSFDWSIPESYTTQYCAPGVSSGNENANYITTVKFIGTLQDTSQTSTFSSSPAGYQDFTGNALKSSQAQGNGINLYVENKSLATCRAWVDWNRDGDFDDAGEAVYTSGTTSIISTTFGFTIPVNALSGDYTVRIRINGSGGATDYTSCGTINYAGETEDYRFTVISNCSAIITSVLDGSQCGEGSVALSATASAGSTELRWYDSLNATVPIATLATTGGTATLWSTPPVTATTVYYVTAYNGSCESLVKTPVKAIIKPVPVISFTPTAPTTCGSVSTIKISASGQNQTDYFINEKFSSGLGVFTAINNISNGATIDGKTKWQNRTSTFQPKEKVWFPAISSGINSNKFVMTTSDVGVNSSNISYITDNVLVSPLVDSGVYTSMTLKFRMYYSRYIADNDPSTSDYVDIDVSRDGGTTWNTIEHIIRDVGYGTNFGQKSYDVSAYVSTQFRFRVHYYGVWRDGVAIDDVELYGVRPLSTSFSWTTSSPIDVYSDSNTTIPYINGSTVTTVYMKPSADQTETTSNWDISATASLSNGCSATGQVTITNNNKVWKTGAGISNWGTTNWLPTNSLPDLTNCVIVRTPVNVPTGGLGLAKEVYVESGGTLNIKKDAALKVQNGFFNNTGNPAAVVVESDGGLIQINEGNTINTGNITAQRAVNLTTARQQYNYLGSPLEGQNMKTVYNGINYVLYYNEGNNYFYSSSGAYIKGRGLAVKEPTLAGVATGPATATFTGYPTNGAFTYPLVNSNPAAVSPANTVRGFNLVANPYPSNIDLNTLYSVNGGSIGNLSSTFYLWDSTVNDIYVQQGSNYGGQSYGLYNAADGTGTAATGDIKVVSLKEPKNIVKMGQAFMVRSKTGSSLLQFNNTIRTNGTAVESYFGKNIPEKTADRYWLKLVSPTGMQATAAVVYFAGGNNGIAEDDSYSMGGSDAISSVVEGQNIAINGRSRFVSTDTVPLATAQYSAGMYTIGLEAKEGIFESQQAVYLKDLQTGTITNLSEGDYTFAATAGASTGRFEVIYEPGTVLATNAVTKEDLMVYRDGGDFVIKSPSKKITTLDVFDAEGRLVYKAHPNATVVRLENSLLINGMYILKIGQNETVSVKKIIK